MNLDRINKLFNFSRNFLTPRFFQLNFTTTRIPSEHISSEKLSESEPKFCILKGGAEIYIRDGLIASRTGRNKGDFTQKLFRL